MTRRDTEILLGDCLDLMREIPDASVDAIITDPPYGCTEAHWDVAVDWQAWWQEIRRIRKPNAPAVIFCSGKFCGQLWATNPKEYRYDWIWVKTHPSQFFAAKMRPLPAHEKIYVFATKMPKYLPQKRFVRNARRSKCKPHTASSLYPQLPPDAGYIDDGIRCPVDVLFFGRRQHADRHPTAKPVALCEYLIRTYTDEGDTILDPFCGGGAVPAAAVRTGRKCIGIEKDPKWYEYAKARVEKEAKQTKISWWESP